MTPTELEKLARRIFRDKPSFWKARLSRVLCVDKSTIHRMMKRPEIPGPVEVAVRGLLEHKKKQDALEREARKLLPARLRRKKRIPRKKKVVVTEKPLDSTPT